MSKKKVRRITLDHKAADAEQINLRNNRVITSKYTFLTFLPMNLFEQFKKAANVYFLIVMFMQMIDVISISNGQPAMLPPLCFVVIISMIKDAYEDYQRHKSDDKENNNTAEVFNPETKLFDTRPWASVTVGQIVRVKEDSFFPADLLLMRSSGNDGLCYVETKNLDGETNLKHKQAPKELNEFYTSDQRLFHVEGGQVNYDDANNQIYKFDGNMIIPEEVTRQSSSGEQNGQNLTGSQIALTNDNILLRGTSLKNTSWVYGAVMYTGHDTKIQMNSARTKYKTSKMMAQTNSRIYMIFVMQICFALVGAITGATWMVNNIDNPYLDFSPTNKWNTSWILAVIKVTGTWILIFTNFVPISLLVTLELVKFWQGGFMQWDIHMYDQEQNLPMAAQSSNLNEELGQIEYVFSDKTGTLTCNIMEFKKFCAGGTAYNFHKPLPNNQQAGEAEAESEHSDAPVQIVTSNPSAQRYNSGDNQEIFDVIRNNSHQDHFAVLDVLLHLALCHTVIIDPRKGTYNASSPDELALVEGAKELGVEFKDRSTQQIMTVQLPSGEVGKYKLMNVLDFNSTRKRMSVIVEDLQSNEIILLTKGADSVIEKLLAPNQDETKFKKCMGHLQEFAIDGLRTLILAKKVIDPKYYKQWNARQQEASQSLIDRDEKLDECNAEMEIDLELVGASAIEDKLQDEVAETIKALKSVGIKVWVLTGDKIETAINIGFSAGLLDTKMLMSVVDSRTNEDVVDQLNQATIKFGDAKVDQKSALVVAGESLLKIQGSKMLRNNFLSVCARADVVVACRVSPKQKADIVTMVRSRYPDKATLAIGDGANDVAMITKAHVGVGIAGREGTQAARTSDFAIGQFKFLKPLLFVHGREAYRRNSDLIQFTFYKNVLYVIAQFWFGFYSVFSGQTLYEPFIYQLYNITFTGLPIIWYALFDYQYTKETLLANPKHYRLGMTNANFSSYSFWKWIVYGMFQALYVLYFCLIFTQKSVSDGNQFGFWAGGQSVYGCCVILANMTLMKMHNNLTGWGEALALSQIVAFYFIMWFEAQLPAFSQLYGIWDEFTGSRIAWLGTFISVAWIFTIDIMVRETLLWVQKMRSSFDLPEEVSSEVKDIEFTELENLATERLEGPYEQAQLRQSSVREESINTHPNKNDEAVINYSVQGDHQKTSLSRRSIFSDPMGAEDFLSHTGFAYSEDRFASRSIYRSRTLKTQQAAIRKEKSDGI